MEIANLIPLFSKTAVREIKNETQVDWNLIVLRTLLSSFVCTLLGKTAGYTAANSFLLTTTLTAAVEYGRTLKLPDHAVRLFARIRNNTP